MARVSFAKPSASGTEWLARVTRSDEIHDSTPRAAVEGREIVPDRSAIQGLVFHPRHEICRRVCFPLDVTDSSNVGHDESQSELCA